MASLPLANGIIIDTVTRQAIAPSPDVEAAIKQERRPDNARKAGRDISNRAFRTAIADLPAIPAATATVGVVWIYYMLGLDDVDIATVTGLKVKQVETIKGMDTFNKVDERIKRNFANQNESDIQTTIAASAANAIEVVKETMQDKEASPSTKLKAAKDILDRAGFAPKQVHEHKMTMNGGLLIKVIHSGNEAAIPGIMIDADVGREMEG
jgi:hypothetical protein